MAFQTLFYVRKWLDFGHMNPSYCRHWQKISIIWQVNPNKICSSKLCPIYIWDFDLKIQVLMWKWTCECWESSLSFSHISNSPLKMHLSQAMPSHQSWLKTPCFTQPWLQAQGWCYDNIPHLKWGPNWHFNIMFEALMFNLSLQLYFWLDFTFPFVLVTMSR
jgi:hypothetical protein